MVKLRQGDTGRALRLTLEDENGAVNVMGATVLFFMDSHEIEAVIESAVEGKVLVIFDTEHTAETGIFQGLIRVTFDDGRVEHYPEDGFTHIEIQKGSGVNG